MNVVVEFDQVFIDFSTSTEERELIDAVTKLADKIINGGVGSEFTDTQIVQWTKHVREFEVAELLLALDADEQMLRVLFLIAEELGAADLEIAWRGLRDVPWAMIGADLAPDNHCHDIAVNTSMAFSIADHADTWIAIEPDTDSRRPVVLCSSKGLLGPLSLQELEQYADVQHESHILGFAQGSMLRIRLNEKAQLPGGLFIPLSATQWNKPKSLYFALLAGLLSGAMRRATGEAYSYAKNRESFGKPIMHHQAVALRLADIALNREAARVFIETALAHPPFDDVPGALGAAKHIGALAHKVARDGVQVAGGYGYVEGLPFKSIYERSKTLSIALEQAMQQGVS